MPYNNPLLLLNSVIREEADEILGKKGLLDILCSYGTPHISGSYQLNLMTWRDLDIYLEVENLSEIDFFGLGGKISAAFNPIKMSYRNEVVARTMDLPLGLYWGIYLGDERNGAWKIDLWAVDNTECKRLTQYCAVIKQKLTPLNILQILRIKSQCWKDPGYRKTYNSMTIYHAVFEKNVTDIEEFRNYLRLFHRH
ncbi:MAG: hypothetical protein JWQ30_381 [Sediminibacterium sp.]|nr:hypothetical protein [Sediminibacterium sp.]